LTGLEFSGLEGFWRAHDTLRRGADVSDVEWKALFATPGYRALTASEFKPEWFVRRWVAAYHPGAGAERSALEAKADRHLKHFLAVSERRAELIRFQAELAGGQDDLLARAERRAREYLPAGREYPPPSGAAFVVFGPDARGYVPVVFDLLHAMNTGPGLWLVLAHESHHQMVCAARGLAMGSGADRRDDLAWVLDQVTLEGVADLVSYDGQQPDPAHPEEEMAVVPAYIRLLEGTLRTLALEPAGRAELGAQLRKQLRWSGHQVGYYMAAAIANHLGHQTLVESALDPALFFASYQRAAEMVGLSGQMSVAAVAQVRAVVGSVPASRGDA
jgi:hypothetical protein